MQIILLSHPKGVVLAHRNLVATMKCLMFMVMPRDDIYIAFLPLAHVLELLAENTMMLFGVKVGYSSPNTMTDMSTKVRKGYKGDATVLRPTMMCAVPLIMDRIYKNVLDSVWPDGCIAVLFQFFESSLVKLRIDIELCKGMNGKVCVW